MKINKKGFTFIEILVVATLIAVLASVGVTSYKAANKKSRDGKRKADIEQIRAALEIYRTDKGYYPTALSALTPVYMAVLPETPTSNECGAGAGKSYDGSCYVEGPAGCDNTSGNLCTSYNFSIDLEAGGSYVKTNP